MRKNKDTRWDCVYILIGKDPQTLAKRAIAWALGYSYVFIIRSVKQEAIEEGRETGHFQAGKEENGKLLPRFNNGVKDCRVAPIR